MEQTLKLTALFLLLASPAIPEKVDFRRDIQPFFQEHCIGCHGPSQQMSGMRLDQRSSAMAIRGGTVIGPGNAAGSRLYLKLIGTKYGTRMPPTGPLTPEQIDLIKNWIDQGAEWPDELSGDKPPLTPDPKAVRLMDALRDVDRKAFSTLVHEDAKIINARGTGGSTPLMYATLYGDLDSVRQLLEAGADPNLKNDAGATALMWAVDDLEKVRLLLDHGANVNAISNDNRSPLAIALTARAPTSVIKLLLDRGAKPDSKSAGNPLSDAGGNEPVLRLLLEHGADAKSLSSGLATAFAEGCSACVDLLIKSAAKPGLSSSLRSLASEDSAAVKTLLAAGAEAQRGSSGLGLTTLMYAAGSESGSADSVKLLIEHGADVNAKSAEGATALDFAQQQGRPEMIAVLKKAGAHEGDPSATTVAKPKPAPTASAAVQRAIPLLQHADVEFLRKSGCVSCHNNNLTAMTVAAARKNGVPVDERAAQSQLRAIAAYLDGNRERYLQGLPVAGGTDTAGYILLGMTAEKYPPSPTTDAMARYIKSRQLADGSWRTFGGRPPMESSKIQSTATALRVVQYYAIPAHHAEYEKSVQLAADWLAKAQPKTNEDRVFQLLGLAWSGSKPETLRKLAAVLIAEQRPDGGWAQLPTLASDAYATGQALVALREAGALTAADPAYKHGAHFLLSSQLEDGSWYVRTRTIPFQPQFDSGFPHGVDQFISDAATNWATMALIGLGGRI